jgi:hypothetical protein
MKKFLLFFSLVLLLSSCKTKQYLIKSTDQDLSRIKRILVIKNEYSNIIPVGIYPQYRIIDDFVVKKVPAIADISNLICNELSAREIDCEIVNNLSEVDLETYYIIYQDYWAWDFKKYMHVLKIRLCKSGREIKSVASQGNSGGMHDYPNPKKQVPLLIDLLLKQ